MTIFDVSHKQLVLVAALVFTGANFFSFRQISFLLLFNFQFR
jgi:hypothetical protein